MVNLTKYKYKINGRLTTNLNFLQQTQKMRIIVLAVLLALLEGLEIDTGCIKRYMVNKHEAKICEAILKMDTNFTSEKAANIQIKKILTRMWYQENPSFWQAYIPYNMHELNVIMQAWFQTFIAIYLVGKKCSNQQVGEKQFRSYFLESIFIQWQVFLIFEIIEYLHQEEKIKMVSSVLLTIDAILFLVWFGYIIIRKSKDQTLLEKLSIIIYLLFGLGSLFGYFQVYKKTTQIIYVVSPIFELLICKINKKTSKDYKAFAMFYLINITRWPDLMYKNYHQYFSPLPFWILMLGLPTYSFLFLHNSKPIQKIHEYIQKQLHVWFNRITLKDYLYIKQEANEEIDCSICLQTMGLREKVYDFECIQLVNNMAIVRTPCNHFFHKHCLSKWMNQSSKCPLDLSILLLKEQ